MSEVPRLQPCAATRVIVSVADAKTASDIQRVLAARGLTAEIAAAADLSATTDASASAPPDAVIAMALSGAPTATTAATLAPLCQRAARARHPVVILAPWVPAQATPSKKTEAHAAALAYLRSAGAVICNDPDVWLETVVLLSGYSVPTGPSVAVVAPPGSLLLLAAGALERQGGGERPYSIERSASDLGPTDTVLVAHEMVDDVPTRVGRAIVVPVVLRGELACPPTATATIALVGMSAAVTAARLAGAFGARTASAGGGLGPAELPEDNDFDTDRCERQIAKLGERAGDHECKVLLSSYGVPVTRQAVATTASAAARIAKKAGYPVEIKPWGPDIATEYEGCPLHTELGNAADVRRAFAGVAREAELASGAPVIVRAAPKRGRELRVRLRPMNGLGWIVMVQIPGSHAIVAARAPLRRSDALELSSALEATRAKDSHPDREALADLLVRASHLATAQRAGAYMFTEIELARVLVYEAGDGAVVVDARARLTASRTT